MADSKLSEMISSSLESIRTIADSGTVVGDPVPTNNGTVIIPVSKISVGFASGGLDYLPKNGEKKDQTVQSQKMPAKTQAFCFGGGGGTGVSVVPICFLVIDKDGNVNILNITNPAAVPEAVGVVDSVSSFIEKAPDIVARFKDMFSKDKKPENGLDDEKLSSEIEKLSQEEQ